MTAGSGSSELISVRHVTSHVQTPAPVSRQQQQEQHGSFPSAGLEVGSQGVALVPPQEAKPSMTHPHRGGLTRQITVYILSAEKTGQPISQAGTPKFKGSFN